MVTWQRELGERDDRIEALVVYDGLGPDVIPDGTRRDAVVSVLVGLVAGMVLVVVLWLVAVWTARP